MTGDENRPALSGTSGIAAWHEDVCIHVPSPNREPACVVEHAEKRYTNSRHFWIWARPSRRGAGGAETFPGRIRNRRKARSSHSRGGAFEADETSFCAAHRAQRVVYENPIQRPPQATPNHRTNDTSAVDRLSWGRSDRSIRTTRRRTVNVKRSTRKSDVIFTQKAKL